MDVALRRRYRRTTQNDFLTLDIFYSTQRILICKKSFRTKSETTTLAGSIFSMDAFFFLFYHQIKSKRNPREQRDKRKIASSVPIGWTQFTFSSQNVYWNGLPLLTQHSLIFLISTYSLDDKASFYLDPNF